MYQMYLFGVCSVLLMLTVALTTGAPVTMDSAENGQEKQRELSCQLRQDRDLKLEFFSALRTKHGFPATSVRSFRPMVNRNDSVPCFVESSCPGGQVTWCFNLYHPTKFIEACWYSSGNMHTMNISKDAYELGLASYFKITEECLYSRGDSCMMLLNTPFFLDGGLLTCTVESKTCTKKAFMGITVEYVGVSTKPLDIQLHSTTELSLGEQNVFLVSVTYPTLPIGFFFSFEEDLNTFINGEPRWDLIPQNGPFCEAPDCQPAGDYYDKLRSNRVRLYAHGEVTRDCPATARTYYTWLVIDDAQSSDVLTEFKFTASVYVFNPFPDKITSELTLNLTIANPEDQMTSSGQMLSPQ